VYHLELRRFPHNQCRFNLGEDELSEIVVPWVRGEWIQVGERNWNVHQARLTILEGPELAAGELTMGRGWRTAQRQGTEVTRQVLERARGAHGVPAGVRDRRRASADAGAARSGREDAVARGEPPRDAEALLGELLALLGRAPEPLLAAWRRAAARVPERSPSESLAAAEEELAPRRAQETRTRSG
jgi:hypothetical protein